MAVLCNAMKFHTAVCNFYLSVFPSCCGLQHRYQLPPEHYIVFADPALWSWLDARLVALVGRDCKITIRETFQKQDFIITGLCLYVFIPGKS